MVRINAWVALWRRDEFKAGPDAGLRFMTQTQLAERAGLCSHTVVSKIESGERRLTLREALLFIVGEKCAKEERISPAGALRLLADVFEALNVQWDEV